MAIFISARVVWLKKGLTGLLLLSLLIPAFLPFRVFGVGGAGDVVTDPVTNINTGLTNANAAATNVTTGKILYIEIEKDLLKSLAVNLLKKVTQDTVNWINSGFDGKPLFVQNSQAFFTAIGNDEIKNTVNEIGSDLVNYPWGREIAKNKIKIQRTNNKSTTQERVGVFDLNTRFGLNSPQEMDLFYNDSRVGGWDGWTAMVDNPNNNPIGFDLALSNDLQKQTTQKINDWNKNISDGMFLPMQKCVDPEGLKRSEEKKARDDGYTMETNPEKFCKRWENTTPSTSVANQIGTALTSGMRQGELSAAVEGSVSAIFGALLNEFIEMGLSTLSTEISGADPVDNWSFAGETLSTSSGGYNPGESSWADGPDEIIVKEEFEKDVADYIFNVEKRLALTTETIKIMDTFDEKSMTLDMCLPGPDMNWEKRFNREVRRESQTFEKKAEKDNEDKAALAAQILAELETASEAFVNHIKGVMITSLPKAPLILDWLNSLGKKQGQLKSFNERQMDDRGSLARLTGIQSSLATLSEPLDDQENEDMVKLWRQFKVLKPKLPQESDVFEAEVNLGVAYDQETDLDYLNDTCRTERATAGYPPTSTEDYAEGMDERQKLCGDNITSTYDGNDVIIAVPDFYPNDISVNRRNIYNENDITVSCDLVYQSYLADYSPD